ncbi:MAG: tetratricopeptide repeat protein, partial [Actinomadura sp.]
LGADGARAVALLRLASAELAAGEFGRAREYLDRADRLDVRAERPQLHTGQAAWHLVVTGDRKAVEHHLDEARRARPRRDGTGQLTDLTNLAVLREDPDVATEYLDQALSLAEDPHAHELMGVQAWRRGRREQAAREWEAAYRLYGRLGDDTGRARCLQHHGAALLAGPGTEPDRDRGREMLVDSLSLRVSGVGIGVALAHLYLGEGARSPAEAARHRARGLEALSPWHDQPMRPDVVTRVRARLEALRE